MKKEIFPAQIKVQTYAGGVSFFQDDTLIYCDGSFWYRLRRGKKEKPEQFISRPENYIQDVHTCNADLFVSASGAIVYIVHKNGNMQQELGPVAQTDYFKEFRYSAVSKDASMIAASCASQQIMLWDRDGKHLYTIADPLLESSAILFTPDASQLITYTSGHIIRIDTKSGDMHKQKVNDYGEARRLSLADNGNLLVQFERHGWMVFDPMGSMIASAESRYNRDVEDFFTTYSNGTKMKGGTQFASIFPDGERVLEGYEKRIRVRNISTMEVLLDFERKKRAEIRDMDRTADDWIAIGTDGAVEFYDLNNPPIQEEPVIDFQMEKQNGQLIFNGIKGNAECAILIHSSEKEAESRHLRTDIELQYLKGNKWVSLIRSYTHGDYADADNLVLEEGSVAMSAFKAMKKQIGSKLDMYDFSVQVAKFTDHADAFLLAVEAVL